MCDMDGDYGSDMDMGADAEFGSEVDMDMGADTGWDLDADLGTEWDLDADLESGLDLGVESDLAAGLELDIDAAVDSGMNLDLDGFGEEEYSSAGEEMAEGFGEVHLTQSEYEQYVISVADDEALSAGLGEAIRTGQIIVDLEEDEEDASDVKVLTR